MRSLAEGQNPPNEIREDWFSICHETIKRFTPQSLSKVLERWQAPTKPPINAMLLALQTATEAYLDTPLNTSDLVTSTKLSKSNRHLLDPELHRLGLRRTLGRIPSALKAAIFANDLSWDDVSWNRPYLSDLYETRLILAVDYSRSALTAGLFIGDNGVLDDYRFSQDTDIGADASPSNFPWSEDLLLKRRRLVQEVARLPVTDAGFELPGRVTELVFIGDRANDDELLELLEEIVETELVARIRDTIPYDSADPIFTAVKGVASLAKQRIDEGEQSCLPWDCKGSWDNLMGL